MYLLHACGDLSTRWMECPCQGTNTAVEYVARNLSWVFCASVRVPALLPDGAGGNRGGGSQISMGTSNFEFSLMM